MVQGHVANLDFIWCYKLVQGQELLACMSVWRSFHYLLTWLSLAREISGIKNLLPRAQATFSNTKFVRGYCSVQYKMPHSTEMCHTLWQALRLRECFSGGREGMLRVQCSSASTPTQLFLNKKSGHKMHASCVKVECGHTSTFSINNCYACMELPTV